MARSPDGNVISRRYVNDLFARTFSISAAPLKLGPLSNLSGGISSTVSFFAEGKKGPPARAVQFGAGISVSYALLSNPFPFSVSLCTESGVEAGFYPIAAWDTGSGTGSPRETMMTGLRALAAGKGTSFVDLHNAFAASRILSMLESFPLNDRMDEFAGAEDGDSVIDRFLKEAGEWDKTGDTGNLPEKLKPPLPPEKMYTRLIPLQTAVTAAFESGYKRGYDSTKRNDTVYADCLSTVRAKAGTSQV